MKEKYISNNRGSAILIALLVMAVLVVVSLGLNGLIVSEMIVQRDETERLKAFYAAESGMERGLLDIYENNMPGYTRPMKIASGITENKDILQPEYFTMGPSITNLHSVDAANYRYQVIGQDMELPCSYDSSISDKYLTLEANQSVTIPLHKYVPDSENKKKEVTDFLVEYYATGAGLGSTQIYGVLKNTDVLRWKIFGINTAINQGYRRSVTGQFTDAISDYLPLNSIGNMADSPSQFATKVDLLKIAGGVSDGKEWTMANYYERTSVNNYNNDSYLNNRTANIFDFLNQDIMTDKHEFNYLMLTNVLGENIKYSGGSFVRDDSNDVYEKLLGKQKLFVRVRADDTESAKKETLACDGFLVRADGFYRGAKQSIDMKISLESFLPVFDFVLYERKL